MAALPLRDLQIPPIDQRVPARLHTATFGLG